MALGREGIPSWGQHESYKAAHVGGRGAMGELSANMGLAAYLSKAQSQAVEVQGLGQVVPYCYTPAWSTLAWEDF